nr:zinc finger FYVE domain-containing protein 16-like [Nerophis lumbriciformis]
MDSFFKAAVCDLDKVLDDFELSAEEADCRSVFWKPQPYDFSTLGSSEVSDLAPTLPPNLLHPSSLHYATAGTSGSLADRNGEVQVQPLTGVDLLSSVDRGASQSSAPPCPDRAPEPLCDLVNDTSSAAPVRVDSRDAFAEPEEDEDREEEALLVDFGDSEERGPPCQNSEPCRQLSGSSFSLLDVILPAVPAENAREVDAQDEGYDEETQEDDVLSEPDDREDRRPSTLSSSPPSGQNEEVSPKDSDDEASGGGSRLPEPKEQVQVEHTAADPQLGLDTPCSEELLDSEPLLLVPPAEPLRSDVPELSPEDPQEFGFEYLPESERAHLPVTDEELDAFLRAGAEAERDVEISAEDHQPRNAVLPDEDLERVFADTELGSRLEDLECPACPESDVVHLGSPFRDSLYQEDSSEGSHSFIGNSLQSEQQLSYGGARPKQPLSPAVRCPSSTEEDDEPPAYSSRLDDDDDDSPCAGRGFALASSPPYPGTSAAASDQLSEPPPYIDDAEEEQLGSRQPDWVPDSEAPNCMNCSQKFTFTKRRHHCRACGKVYCGVCCNRKSKLKYLEKEARVCVVCFDTLHRAQALERMMSPAGPSPNPNVPSEYCSTIPPLQQARAAGTLTSAPPTVMVPVSALKQPSSDGGTREHKRVWFADGILPNGEVADTTKLSATSGRGTSREAEEITPSSGSEVPEPQEVIARPPCGPWDYSLLAGLGPAVRKAPSLLPDDEDQLPPLLVAAGEDMAGDVLVEESPAPCQIRHLLEEGGPRPLTFVLNANLLVNIKIVTYGGRQCWCLGSNGLRAWGQRELVFLLERVPEERNLPRDLLALFLSVQQDAQRGKFVEELDNVSFAGSFLDSKDHGGMLFFSPSFQPLDGLPLPDRPFLFGVLVHKLEVPWAKVFPLRLLLRLGAEYSVYPGTPVSVRFRPSVYRETGHTIMNLLADLRNYQYSLPSVKGLTIHMEMGHSYIDIPKSSFDEMQKVVSAANEHVISIGAEFSRRADSHLVCFQNEDGTYQTRASSAPGKTREVTGAGFVVFNGALKASSGFIAKSSIVEDGLMVQMPAETMEALRAALRDQNDFDISCGKTDQTELRETVTVRWLDSSPPTHTGSTSAVDGRSLDDARGVRMRQDGDFRSDGRAIGCSEVFYRPPSEPSCDVFQKEVAAAACGALTRHLAVLTAGNVNSLSLRVSTHGDVVEYQAGSGGCPLPQHYMNELDSALIPVIHGGSSGTPPPASDVELLFFITHAI